MFYNTKNRLHISSQYTEFNADVTVQFHKYPPTQVHPSAGLRPRALAHQRNLGPPVLLETLTLYSYITFENAKSQKLENEYFSNWNDNDSKIIIGPEKKS